MNPTPSPRDIRFAIASCAVLAAYNNVIGAQPWHRRWYTPINVCATGAALSAAAANGLTAADVGLGRDTWRPGGPGSALAAAAAGGWLVAAALPVTRPFLKRQADHGPDRARARLQVAVSRPRRASPQPSR